jgi:hypothetical protein
VISDLEGKSEVKLKKEATSHQSLPSSGGRTFCLPDRRGQNGSQQDHAHTRNPQVKAETVSDYIRHVSGFVERGFLN